ncbi:hypothetical protein HMPREF1051_1165 [Neisseria sicca VK64]|uniref:Uncharacterized protein n=1 Tax=Neisseria sicca VK64 TaxID=1095748 RepID=I2NEM8_NEISI|nr:hypothetical protein HMPREF1051_1165 [Neisseria sicca VK64]
MLNVARSFVLESDTLIPLALMWYENSRLAAYGYRNEV